MTFLLKFKQFRNMSKKFVKNQNINWLYLFYTDNTKETIIYN